MRTATRMYDMYVYKHLLDRLPALTQSSLGFEPLGVVMWLFVDVRIIAVAEIISARLSLADLYTPFARYHRRRYCHLHARHSLPLPHHLEP
jgi:hypothetical protein